MDQELRQQIARNEAIFRDVNEAIRGGRWPGEEDAPVAFRCECGQLGCNRMIELAVREYERIRGDPRWFVLAAGHDIPEVEAVLESNTRYVVVEKREAAGRVAEETDPRS
jgi:hypothetical protein